MSRRLLIAVFALVLLLMAGRAAFVLFVLRDGEPEDQPFARLSVRERPFQLPIPERLTQPGTPPLTGEVRLVTERKGMRFIRLPRRDGSSCWGTAERRSGEWTLTNYTCETQFQRFPDPKAPVLVLSRGGTLPGTQLRFYEAFDGLAADGIARVGIIDGEDRVRTLADVIGNAFVGESPDRFKSVVALDAAGEVIWRSQPVPLPDE